MNPSIFRKQALEKIESPERLNELVKVTDTKSWLALISLALLFVILIIWAFAGTLPEIITGQGILLQPGGVTTVSAYSGGIIHRVFVKEGDSLVKNQVVASIDQSRMEIQIKNAKAKLEDMAALYRKQMQYTAKNIKESKNILLKDMQNLVDNTQLNEKILKEMQRELENTTLMLEKGLISKQKKDELTAEYENLKIENERLKNEINKKTLESIELSYNKEITLSPVEIQIHELARSINEMEMQLELFSLIRSPVNGKVIEIMVNSGNVISDGAALMSIEPEGIEQDIEAIIYVHPYQGKKIKKGMSTKIAPTTIETEKYGYITGIVSAISEFPASKQGMLRTLGNIDLVNSFSKEMPPISISITLNKNSASASGFQWTSKKGPQIKIKTGTLCTGKILVHQIRPISLLFPGLFKD